MYDLTVGPNNLFYRGREVPGTATKEQTKAYEGYVATCDAERCAAMGFNDWVQSGEPASLAAYRNANHKAYVADMKAKYGEGWVPEDAGEEGGSGARATKTARVPKFQRDPSSAGSTKRVWAIADELLAKNADATKREIVAECIKRGINKGTAQVQAGKWEKARTA